MPDTVLDKMPERMSEYMPERMSDRIVSKSKYIPAKMSDGMSETMSKKKCVRVGIARNSRNSFAGEYPIHLLDEMLRLLRPSVPDKNVCLAVMIKF